MSIRGDLLVEEGDSETTDSELWDDDDYYLRGSDYGDIYRYYADWYDGGGRYYDYDYDYDDDDYDDDGYDQDYDRNYDYDYSVDDEDESGLFSGYRRRRWYEHDEYDDMDDFLDHDADDSYYNSGHDYGYPYHRLRDVHDHLDRAAERYARRRERHHRRDRRRNRTWHVDRGRGNSPEACTDNYKDTFDDMAQAQARAAEQTRWLFRNYGS
ncbi:hypothetical protein HRR78_005341 [Exophiala dermatitidis]|nr:hypothetical protein HRR75_005576 [Exophiala dermatitidis]KAJ4547241.1 hypothetical protein HRR78_005341 [Exophiala dermatitidis]